MNENLKLCVTIFLKDVLEKEITDTTGRTETKEVHTLSKIFI